MTALIIGSLWLTLVALRGFVLTIMWKWFIVPLGVVDIGFFHAIGIAMTISIFTQQAQKEEIDMANAFLSSFALSVIALIFGFIFQLFL